MTETLNSLFIKLNIDCLKLEHAALETCVDADRLMLERPGTRLKNLFLRDNYGRRHFLLLTAHDKKVDLKALSKEMQIARLGFASAQRLEKYLAVKPGCVSALALVNDTDNAVELWVDERVWKSGSFHCHPFVNTSTWVLEKNDLIKLWKYTNHCPRVIKVPDMATE